MKFRKVNKNQIEILNGWVNYSKFNFKILSKIPLNYKEIIHGFIFTPFIAIIAFGFLIKGGLEKSNDGLTYHSAFNFEQAQSNVLGIPEGVISIIEKPTDIEGITEEVSLGENSGTLYIELDENDNFYHVSYSDELIPFFNKVPTILLFDGFSNTELHTVTAGAHSDCMQNCRDMFF